MAAPASAPERPVERREGVRDRIERLVLEAAAAARLAIEQSVQAEPPAAAQPAPETGDTEMWEALMDTKPNWPSIRWIDVETIEGPCSNPTWSETKDKYTFAVQQTLYYAPVEDMRTWSPIK